MCRNDIWIDLEGELQNADLYGNGLSWHDNAGTGFLKQVDDACESRCADRLVIPILTGWIHMMSALQLVSY